MLTTSSSRPVVELPLLASLIPLASQKPTTSETLTSAIFFVPPTPPIKSPISNPLLCSLSSLQFSKTMVGALMKLKPLSTPNTQQAFFNCSPNSPLLDRSSRSVGGCAGPAPDLLCHRPPISGLVLLPETHIITVVQWRSPAAHSFVFESVNVDQGDNDNSIISRIISSMLDSIGSTSARTGNTANDIREMISERLARASSDGGISDSTHPHPNPSNSQRGSQFSSATPLGPQNPALKIRKVREEIKMNKSEKNQQNQQIASLEKQMADSMSETEKNMDKLGLSPLYAEVLEQLNEKSFELEIGDVVDETKNASCVDVRHSRIFCRQF